MSRQLISRSEDLTRLQNEGYELEIRGSYLLMHHVPYVTSNKEVKYGTLVTDLQLKADVTTTPKDHVVHFAGEYPCNRDGRQLTQVVNSSQTKTLDKGVVVNHMFSSKPKERYQNYYDKMTTYVAILGGPAEAIDPAATAKTFAPVPSGEGESVFVYLDTASSRAGISAVTRKLELQRIAIVGLGGTGSYVLDLVAKTPVREIHLFDGDCFCQHNAFRAPGAASLSDLKAGKTKAAYFQEQYVRMRRGIIAHPEFVSASNVHELREMDFVFLCLDGGDAKKLIVRKLEEYGRPFIDVGIGLQEENGSLGGLVRVTLSTPECRDHVWEKDRISFSDGGADNDYSRNIQVADLNALNAALAVVRWKKYFGFYRDLDQEHHSTYTIDGNMLLNEDKP